MAAGDCAAGVREGLTMPCPECAGHKPFAEAFDRLLTNLERRFERLERKWGQDPNAENTAALNAVRLVLNAAVREYNMARDLRP